MERLRSMLWYAMHLRSLATETSKSTRIWVQTTTSIKLFRSQAYLSRVVHRQRCSTMCSSMYKHPSCENSRLVKRTPLDPRQSSSVDRRISILRLAKLLLTWVKQLKHPRRMSPLRIWTLTSPPEIRSNYLWMRPAVTSCQLRIHA